jgi:ribosomal-protein-alanine N-acetyltransferase
MSLGPSTSSFTIELARSRDAFPIARLSRDEIESGLAWSWRPERVRAAIRSPTNSVVAARCRDLLLGFAVMRFLDEEARLNLLAVEPRYRRRGVGRCLVRWLEESALTAGISVVYLEVRAGNQAAQRFYESLGYRTVQVLRGYYMGQESAFRLARDLWEPPPNLKGVYDEH